MTSKAVRGRFSRDVMATSVGYGHLAARVGRGTDTLTRNGYARPSRRRSSPHPGRGTAVAGWVRSHGLNAFLLPSGHASRGACGSVRGVGSVGPPRRRAIMRLVTSPPPDPLDLRSVRRAYDTVAEDYASHLPDTRAEAPLDLAMVDA